MSAENGAPARAGCPGWAKLLLIGSLALNVAVVGVFAGSMMNKSDKRGGAGNQIEWILKFVPENRRDFTKAHFKAMRSELKAAHQMRRENIEQILSAVRAEPFSVEALQSAMDSRLDTKINRNRLVQDGLVTLLEQFTQDERVEFAQKLEARIKKAQQRREE